MLLPGRNWPKVGMLDLQAGGFRTQDFKTAAANRVETCWQVVGSRGLPSAPFPSTPPVFPKPSLALPSASPALLSDLQGA